MSDCLPEPSPAPCHDVEVSVVIVNYNGGALLADAVASVIDARSEVLVVDNDSRDDSLAVLEERFAPPRSNLVIIRNRSNLGFAAACNIGARAARGRRLLFLNPDGRLAPGAREALLQALEDRPDAGMLGGLLLNPDGSEQAGGRRAIPTPWRSLVRLSGLFLLEDRWPVLFYDFHLHKQPLPDHPVEVEAISGACMLVRREAMDAVGLWDEGYFLHCEDLDWCMRFRQAGWKILFVPDARIIHVQGTCSRSRPWFVEWHKHKGMVRFYRKFFRQQYSGALMIAVIAAVWLRFGAIALVHAARMAGRKIRNGS